MGKAFKLRSGLLLLSTEAPGGIYNSAQLKKIAALCDGETALAKATEDQRIALFVAPEQVAKVAAELKAVGLGARHYQDGLHQPVNCLGELCGEHLQDAMGTSMDLSRELAGMASESALKIGINGCARCCVATHTLDISIIGDSHGYRVSLGGKNSQLPEMASFMAEGVPAAKLPKLIAKVIGVYRELAQKGESFQEVMERAGSKKFIDALAPYSQDAAHDDPFAGMSGAPAATGGEAGDDLKLDDLPAGEDLEERGPDVDLGVGSAATGPADPEPDLSGLGADDELPTLDEASAATEELALDDAGGDPAADPGLDDAGGKLALDDDSGLAGGADPADDDLALADGADSADGDLALDDGAGLGDGDLALDDGAALASDADLADGDLNLDDSELEGAGVMADAAAIDDADLDAAAAEQAGTGVEPETFDDDDSLALADDQSLELDETASLPPEVMEDDPELTEESLTPRAVAAPVPSTKPPMANAGGETADGELAEDDLAADEVDENEADAFEQKLNDSIAEEESLGKVEDLNSGDRMEAVKLVEAGAGAPGGEAEPESLEVDESGLDELEIDHQGDEPAPAAAPTPVRPAKPQASVPAAAVSARPAPAAAFELSGFDVAADGRVLLQFSSGAEVGLDPRVLAGGSRRELRIAGKTVVIAPAQGGVSVELDGVAIFVPRQAA